MSGVNGINDNYVFPAPAGVILLDECEDEEEDGFPRTCGGDPTERLRRALVRLFSPHLRG